MKITKINIEKFRWFSKVHFSLWWQLTVIVWQNGTQKTTLLWMLSQPFAITDKNNKMYGQKPLSWWNFKSDFSEKFKLSDEFDKPWFHKWSLEFDDSINNKGETQFSVISILRKQWEKAIRFWKESNTWKGNPDKTKWAWYIQMPVIFLSLKRVIPIWEETDLKEDTTLVLSEEEKQLFNEWHSRILILTREYDSIDTITSLKSSNKNTVWINTHYYDWKWNSAWQDNISKILLSILSFKRLKETCWDDYKGWLLVIDEIDATLYPAAQVKLLEYLCKWASKYDIQVIFTTHSMTILEAVDKLLQTRRSEDIKMINLKKEDQKILVYEQSNYGDIRQCLALDFGVINTSKSKNHKRIFIYTEDREAMIFAKFLLWKRWHKDFYFPDVKLWCENYRNLADNKVPEFLYPNSIIILDGDATHSNRYKNFLRLPWDNSPEKIFAEFLYWKLDSDWIWEKLWTHFSHQYCFRDYSYQDIVRDRDKAKRWFNNNFSDKKTYTSLFREWTKTNREIIDDFQRSFDLLRNKLIW